MDKYTVNLEDLNNTLNGPKTIKYAEIRDQVRKVAFDVVTFRNDPETLWRVVQGEDGNDYIVSMYAEPEGQLSAAASDNVKTASKNEDNYWSVEVSKLGKDATIFYKNTPITKISVAGIDDVDYFKFSAPKLLNKNASMVSKMIGSLDEGYKKQILSMYPELQ